LLLGSRASLGVLKKKFVMSCVDQEEL
jgi:hypothetical protein